MIQILQTVILNALRETKEQMEKMVRGGKVNKKNMRKEGLNVIAEKKKRANMPLQVNIAS